MADCKEAGAVEKGDAVASLIWCCSPAAAACAAAVSALVGSARFLLLGGMKSPTARRSALPGTHFDMVGAMAWRRDAALLPSSDEEGGGRQACTESAASGFGMNAATSPLPSSLLADGRLAT